MDSYNSFIIFKIYNEILFNIKKISNKKKLKFKLPNERNQSEKATYHMIPTI